MKRYEKANRDIHAPEELKERAAGRGKRAAPGRRAAWIGGVAAVLAVAILAGAALWPAGGLTGHQPGESEQPSAGVRGMAAVLSEAEYPEQSAYPDGSDYCGADGELDWDAYEEALESWYESDYARRALAPEDDGLDSFYAATLPQFLGGSNGRNVVYSPLNVYLALGMLAELTDGDSRQQVLDLMGADSIGEARELASALWQCNYRDDGTVTSLLGSSLWLNEDVSFVQETMDRLAEIYYASSYQGEMGSDALDQALRDWIDEQTGGLLKEYSRGLEFNADTVLALATTIYFKARWRDEFDPDKTAPRVFHSPSGDVTADFMNQQSETNYYWADRFSAVCKRFDEGGSMWLLLPDEGTAVDDLLTDPQVLALLDSPYDWTDSKYLRVNLSMPKFDVSSQLDLIEGLKALGVTDVFDHTVSDFTPMTTAVDGIYVSQATHAARVKVDEEGCEAAAFTIMMVESTEALPPEEEVDFVLDRPFLFAVTSETGQLLFTGVVNQV